MRTYVFAEIDPTGFYDSDEAFEDPIKAIEMAMEGKDVAVLDALSYEFYGYI